MSDCLFVCFVCLFVYLRKFVCSCVSLPCLCVVSVRVLCVHVCAHVARTACLYGCLVCDCQCFPHGSCLFVRALLATRAVCLSCFACVLPANVCVCVCVCV